MEMDKELIDQLLADYKTPEDFLGLFHLPYLVHLQANVLLLPTVKRLFVDTHLADHLRHRHAHLGLL